MDKGGKVKHQWAYVVIDGTDGRGLQRLKLRVGSDALCELLERCAGRDDEVEGLWERKMGPR